VRSVVDVEWPAALIALVEVAQHLGQQHALDVTLGCSVGAVGAAAARGKEKNTSTLEGLSASCTYTIEVASKCCSSIHHFNTLQSDSKNRGWQQKQQLLLLPLQVPHRMSLMLLVPSLLTGMSAFLKPTMGLHGS
jgi:hypothetical protein